MENQEEQNDEVMETNLEIDLSDSTSPPTSPLHVTKTHSSDLSLTLLETPDQYKDDFLNEEELRTLAQSLAPSVATLLDTNEKVLEDLMNSDLSWDNDDDKFGKSLKYKRGDISDDDSEMLEGMEEDGMEDEWNGLSNAEQILSDELGLVSMGFNFTTNNEDDNYDENEESDYENDENPGTDYSDHGHQPGDEGKIEATENSETEQNNKVKSMARNLLDEANEDESIDSDSGKGSDIDKEQKNEKNLGMTKKPTEIQKSSSPLASSANRQAYTLYDHAKCVDLQFSNIDIGYPTCPLLTIEDAEALLDVPSFRHEMLSSMDKNLEDDSNEGDPTSLDPTSLHSDVSSVEADDLQRASSSQFKDAESRQKAIKEIMACTREFIKPMNRTALSRIFEGLVDNQKSDLKSKIKQSKRQQQQKEQHGKSDSSDDDGEDRGVCITSNGAVKSENELLPIRTVAIQIRPDVLCGAVMDATHTAIHSLRGEITKRQGNHLRALVPGCWIPESSYVAFRPDEGNNPTSIPNLLSSPMMSPLHTMNGMAFLPPFVVDTQLCTRKRSRDGERICLFRFYRIHEHQVVDGNLICPPSPPHASINTFNSDLIPDSNECNSILRESSALFQRMRAVAKSGGNIGFEIGGEDDNSAGSEEKEHNSSQTQSVVRQVLTSPLKLFSPREKRQQTRRRKKSRKKSLSVRFQSIEEPVIQGEKAAQKHASERLLNSFIATPSVVDENENPEMDPIPSLSTEDWPFVQSCWRYITMCLNELDNRDLNYSSLVSCPFGAFPALPTLDGQLCSQIKALCKDNMIGSLLRGAQELEEFAREAEYSCAKLISLLEPAFQTYNLKSPAKPDPISLASYPLTFTPPEVSCPPWGQRVVEALNVIAAKSPSADSCFLNDLEHNLINTSLDADLSKIKNDSDKKKTEFQKAREASALVLAAFMKQEDEELSARLGRKNLQVMDRLAKMQAHKRNLIICIRDEYGTNTACTKFADKFHAYAQPALKESKHDSPSSDSNIFYAASDQVPLITCRSLFGKAPATCFVTYHEILLITHPILGASQTFLCKLSDIFLTIKSAKAKSLLNPIPSTVSIMNKTDRKEIFSFRPLMGARPLKELVDVLLDIASESEEALQFSSGKGMLHIFDEKEAVEKKALGDKS